MTKETRIMQIGAAQILRSPRTAQLLRSAHGHEVVHGTTGSGKTTLVKQLLADDEALGREIRIIDPLGVSLTGWLNRSARFETGSYGDAGVLELPGVGRHGAVCRAVTVTIEDAARVFDNRTTRSLIERALNEAHNHDVRFRVVVNGLHLSSFGGSQLVRAALLYRAESVAS